MLLCVESSKKKRIFSGPITKSVPHSSVGGELLSGRTTKIFLSCILLREMVLKMDYMKITFLRIIVDKVEKTTT